jgi:two-component system phosphate regulon sensor histidine kinase PhoR
LSGLRTPSLAVPALAGAAAALGGWAAGARPGALAGAAIASALAVGAAGMLAERERERLAAALRGLAAALREGRLGLRLPGGWRGGLRPLADALGDLVEGFERRLRASEAQRTRLEAVIEAMEEAVLVVDADERVLLANPRLRELFSSPGAPVPLDGRTLLEAVRQRDVVDTLRAALRAGETREREVAIGAAGERAVRFQVAPFVQPDGSRGAVAVFHDVTELRRVESMRRDFVANASHELKTPLTSIRGYAERLSDQKLPDGAVRAVEAIAGNARRLQVLVEDLLELSRIESGSMPLRPEAVSTAELARRLLADLDPRLRAGQLEADVDAAGDTGAWVDRRALEQILVNLLDNAIKYTPAGGRIAVRIGEGEGGRLQLAVEDTGIGIPRKDLPRIFERFYRVDPGRSRALGGTGLGLAIVKHLVQAVGGQVGVESQPGHGSCFWVALPRPEAGRDA